MEANEELENKLKNRKPMDHGVILSFECLNFMCHKHLEVKLGPHLNFIIGRNGSGKSAVLTGLTICLGGKVQGTNRGKSLKDLIKDGTEQARLITKIKNKGEGFQPKVYGDMIIIERSFTKDGSSGYKLKAESGKIISTKKETLDEITDFFQIQVDNPMNILTQDKAREFLASSSDKQKYEFFMKGVQLDKLQQDYEVLRDSADKITAILHSKKELVAELKLQLAKAEARYKETRKLDDWKRQIQNLMRQYAWAQIEAQERVIAEEEKNLETLNARVESAFKKIEEFDKLYKKAKEAYEQSEKLVEQVKEEVGPLKEKSADLLEDFQKRKDELQDIRSTQRSQHEQMKSYKQALDNAQRRLDAENRRVTEAQNNVPRWEAALQAARDRKKELFEEEAVLQGQQRAAMEHYKQVHDEAGDCSKRQAECRHNVTDAEARVSSARTGEVNLDAKYGGHKMRQVLGLIQQEHRWKEKPIGPMAEYITLLRPEWSYTIETLLNSSLSGFIVFNQHDQRLLSDIMKRVSHTFPIMIANHGSFNYNEPHPDYLTVLRALKIDNKDVERQLVINNYIEQSVLYESLKQAQMDMRQVDRTRDYISACYARHPSSKTEAFKVVIGADAAGINPVQGWRRNPRMKMGDKEQELRNAQQYLRSAEEALRNATRAYEEKKKEEWEADRAVKEVNRARSGVRNAITRQDHAIEEAQQALDDAQLASKVPEYEDAVKEDVTQLELQITDTNEAFQRVNAAHAEAKKLYEECKAEIFAKEKKYEDSIRAKQQSYNALEKANKTLLYWRKKAEEEEAVREEQQEKLDGLKEDLAASTVQAENFCARVPVPPNATPERIKAKLNKLRDEVKQFEAQLGATIEEIEEQFEKAKERYETAQNQIQEGMDLRKALGATYEHRQYRWKQFQIQITQRARSLFAYLMSERNFVGRLRLDHKNRLLKLEVQTNNQDSKGGRGARSLSGGEKSFSTICLLLSLWEAMGSSLRCLDEFDVFMDSINRKLSINMIVRAARRSIGKQFILITPQDMAYVDTSPDVKVVKLSPPERGQQTLTETLQ
ncbi:P-loop containing nucleoside triphosphate hydrolase protein [Ascobolus immersus RN42]|uniref:P-loop containing nucleoside triphosphate hydrolase protein n=1 Tax=Ascobolus immersus RN42 TaxID=1160509 RepID=A0A3N4HQI2_ASCIM|nr:P-loop containing nucleoside triphosphate hydrolase protein [Ascobolus immersus RN42]